VDLDGRLDLAVANGHIDETVRNIRETWVCAGSAAIFEIPAGEDFTTWRRKREAILRKRKWGVDWPLEILTAMRFDLLVTTNNGPAYLYRNDQSADIERYDFICGGRNRIAMR